MKVAVIGTGYVGLVTGTCFAESGNDVICVDNDQEKLAKLHAGQVPIYEPGLEELFERNTKAGRLSFTDSLADAVAFAQVIFLALPTPPMEDGSADLKYVLGVANEISKLITEYKVIINKSTVPVGTGDLVEEVLAKHTTIPFDVISNPEFLREGFAVKDFMRPERVVIGTDSEKAQTLMRELYEPFVDSLDQVLFMDRRSAEVTKYAANAFLATKISFMNEIAQLCERVGANVDNIRRGMGTDSRIGHRFLYAGVGYGGSCFPKDVSALFKTSRAYEYHFDIIDAVMRVNYNQKLHIVGQIKKHFGEDLTGLTFGVWGLAFKPNTDDIREAPAIVIIRELLKAGAKVKSYDPEAMESIAKYTELGHTMVDGMYTAIEGVDALIVVTEWDAFRQADLTKVHSLLKQPLIFDGRNIYDLEKVDALGFTYYSIGRSVIKNEETIPTR